jgi:hypothetical protein
LPGLGSGRPLSRDLQDRFEGAFARDLSSVRIHRGARAARVAGALRSRAFTYGQNIVFGSGQPSPSSPAGAHLLAHELAHTIQQRSGRSVIQRKPFAHDSCSTKQAAKIEDAVDRAPGWLRTAIQSLDDPEAISSELWTHFRLRPTDRDGIRTVREKLQMMKEGASTSFPLLCEADSSCQRGLPEGAEEVAFVRQEAGLRALVLASQHVRTWSMGFCEAGFKAGRRTFTGYYIHELAHAFAQLGPDSSYRGDSDYPGSTPLENADSYESFVVALNAVARLRIGFSPLAGYFGNTGSYAFVLAADLVTNKPLLLGVDLSGGVSAALTTDGRLTLLGRVGLEREIPRVPARVGLSVVGGYEPTDSSAASDSPRWFAGGGLNLGIHLNRRIDLTADAVLLRNFGSEEDRRRLLLSLGLRYDF